MYRTVRNWTHLLGTQGSVDTYLEPTIYWQLIGYKLVIKLSLVHNIPLVHWVIHVIDDRWLTPVLLVRVIVDSSLVILIILVILVLRVLRIKFEIPDQLVPEKDVEVFKQNKIL